MVSRLSRSESTNPSRAFQTLANQREGMRSSFAKVDPDDIKATIIPFKFNFTVAVGIVPAAITQPPDQRIPPAYVFRMKNIRAYMGYETQTSAADVLLPVAVEFQIREVGSRSDMFFDPIALASILSGENITKDDAITPAGYLFPAGEAIKVTLSNNALITGLSNNTVYGAILLIGDLVRVSG